MAIAELAGTSAMRDVLEAYPGAQRALMRRYHIGGCKSCGFAPDDRLGDVREGQGAVASSPAARSGQRALVRGRMAVFIGLVACAHLGGRHSDRVDLGAQLFFWSRVAYWPIYVAGVPYVRTMVWYGAIAGLLLIFSALL